MSKDAFNHWYRSRFEQFREQPPAEAWENISNELDLAEVWDKVDAKLTATERAAVFRSRAIRAAAAIAILLLSGSLLRSAFTSDEKAQIAENTASYSHRSNLSTASSKVRATTGQAADANENGKKADDNASNPAAAQSQGSHSSPGIASNSSASFTNKFRKSSAHSGSAMRVTSADAQSAVITDSYHSVEAITPIAATIAEVRNEPSIAESAVKVPGGDNGVVIYKPTSAGLSFGAFYGINNTWLLNRTTLAGLRQDALYHTHLTFRDAHGFSVVQDLKGKWGVQADAYISEQAQNYSYYEEGFFTTKTTEIDYYRMNVLLRNRKGARFFNTSLPASRVLLFGGNVKKLKASEVFANTPTRIPAVTYSSFDYGLQAGYEYEVQVCRSLVVATGISADIGLVNINRGRTAEPAKFDVTHNASLGANLGLRYIIPE